jgi:hypothetical protein
VGGVRRLDWAFAVTVCAACFGVGFLWGYVFEGWPL